MKSIKVKSWLVLLRSATTPGAVLMRCHTRLFGIPRLDVVDFVSMYRIGMMHTCDLSLGQSARYKLDSSPRRHLSSVPLNCAATNHERYSWIVLMHGLHVE